MASVMSMSLLGLSRTAHRSYSFLLPPQSPHPRRRCSLSFNLETSSPHAALKLSLLPRPFRPNPSAARSRPPITAIFTGIVEEMGRVDRIGPSGDADGGFQIRIAASTVLGGVNLGDSISVNGTCLTVSAFDLAASHFTVGLSPETLRRTALSDLASGSPVNLERALQPVSRMGGHFVQGHVDGTGEITSFVPEGDSLWVKVRVAPELLHYVVPKGFIAVDGVSLTVVGVYEDESCFDFMLVAYTQQKVVIPLKKVADKVNLEVDIVGKYVEKLLNNRFGDANPTSSSSFWAVREIPTGQCEEEGERSWVGWLRRKEKGVGLDSGVRDTE
ncbi:hypothetical protein ZIOFF_053927 [Zingiber officinale]|uniref:Riboflavin synthase n=2 Tax=Zingiber officinale TaxID=94328 RepID=A0A8J5KQN0_ZINOF|nr:hypothetical protein ZIOFF_053927 [Zingiber officinale]